MSHPLGAFDWRLFTLFVERAPVDPSLRLERAALHLTFLGDLGQLEAFNTGRQNYRFEHIEPAPAEAQQAFTETEPYQRWLRARAAVAEAEDKATEAERALPGLEAAIRKAIVDEENPAPQEKAFEAGQRDVSNWARRLETLRQVESMAALKASRALSEAITAKHQQLLDQAARERSRLERELLAWLQEKGGALSDAMLAEDWLRRRVNSIDVTENYRLLPDMPRNEPRTVPSDPEQLLAGHGAFARS